MAEPLHTAALLIGIYVLIGLIRYPINQWRAVVLAVLPTLVAGLVIGFDWPGGLVITLVFVVSMSGYQAQGKLQKATSWLVAQIGILAALVALTCWAGASTTVLPAVAAAVVLLAGAVVTIEWGGEWVGRAIRHSTAGVHDSPRRLSTRADHHRTAHQSLPRH